MGDNWGVSSAEPSDSSRVEPPPNRVPPGLSPAEARITREFLETATALAGDEMERLDRKILNSVLKEMRFAIKVFAPYRGLRKASVFGSARARRGDSTYELTVEFARAIAERGWMVITGAGPGIMAAGHEGAGPAQSFGVNIRLPFEAEPNEFIAQDEKLVNFKYFFTRKLMFVREADAFVLLPGGFGTMDEVAELLTLTQTGKSDLHPIVMLAPPGDDYWEEFDRFLRRELLEAEYVCERDLHLYRIVHSVADAADEIQRFYRVYHSQRIVDGRLILRLNTMPETGLIDALSDEFSHMLGGPIERATASREEVRDADAPELARLSLDFDWAYVGDLRLLVDRLNEAS